MEVQDLISKIGNHTLRYRDVVNLCGIETYDMALLQSWLDNMHIFCEENNTRFDSSHWIWVYDEDKIFGKPVNILELFAEKLLRGKIINTVDAYEVSVAFRLLQEDQRACHEVSTMKSEYE